MRHCYVLRVFARGEEGGNHLGVVLDLTALDLSGMQSIAADLGFSETVFVDASRDVPHCRIFTPTAELPFAGHPLVGAAWVLHALSPLAPSQLTCEVGLIGVVSDPMRTTIQAPGSQSVRVLDAFELEGLDLPAVRSASSVAMPLPYTMIEVATAEQVAAYIPDEARLSAHRHGDMLALWAGDHAEIRMRFFAPGHGILEDPATGSAAVALAAVLRSRGLATGAVTVHQGAEVGMPSEIALDWDADATRVGGHVRHDETRELAM